MRGGSSIHVIRMMTFIFGASSICSACSNGMEQAAPSVPAPLPAPPPSSAAAPLPAAAAPTGPLCVGTGVGVGGPGAAPAVAAPTVQGAAGAPSAPIAVVILMPPGDTADPAHARDPRTYKLSLTTNSESATIEVDGQQMGTARVQRVYPQEPDRGPARPLPPAPVQARPVRRALPLPVPGDTDPTNDPTARPSELTFAHRPAILNPNGAPIID